MTAPVPIAEQIAEVERELRERDRRYPALVATGRLKHETAARKVRELQAARASLHIIAAHADGLRLLLSYLRRPDVYATAPEPTPAEREAMLAQPAVQSLLATFPDAMLTGIAPVIYPQAPDAADTATEPEEALP